VLDRQTFAASSVDKQLFHSSAEHFVERSAPASPTIMHAGFWLRFLAAAVDFAILALFVGVVVSFYSVATHNAKQFVEQLHPGAAPSQMIQIFGMHFLVLLLCLYIFSNWLYFAVSESSQWQCTPGKKFVGLYVTDQAGRGISFARASARFFGGRLLLHIPMLGIPYFLIDCMVAAIPPKKQAIHDQIARCLVLRRPGPLSFGVSSEDDS
jgi:uncharacterized RDD family membrane protein YckC